MNKILLILVLTLILSAAVQASTITVDGREWRQVTDTVNISWDQMAAIYDTNTGLLLNSTVSSIGAVEFSGWTWASILDVEQMFETLMGRSFPSFGVIAESDSIYPAKIFDAGFIPTEDTSSVRRIYGTTSNVGATFPGSTAAVSDHKEAGEVDSITVAGSSLTNWSNYRLGHWMYRTETPVPEPSTFLLFGVGILGLTGFTRRKV